MLTEIPKQKGDA
jgi:transposase